ncbi:PaaI family thioesterase [Aquisalimonas sp.]|uniref:PaaI family thioesterase n=1 Tax=Aquisalimonas sp. TaxID=1872621 RepID=UPI0025BF3F29|nr:PaaI family thioesterase [Aquisalimonas sp.]
MQYVGHIEFAITSRAPEQVTAEMPIQAGILNPFGTVHAGATLWFADVTATHLVLEGRDPTAGMVGFPLAINLSANLAGNQADGVFTAVARYVKRGRSVSIVRTTVTGHGERLIADVTTSHVASK